ncbi:peptidylprolyl isomerase [uncultured Brachyspira sp.]|uniref:peptidylprolyl isomerase n=1 Tax=uncultured Brachyspira sp. TaxID=221953 RepID=UPI0026349A3F|nr:peptidylprolyl isomerase [uncultured Brachyspira sp.]
MKKTIFFILSIFLIQYNLLFNDVVNSIVGIVGSMPITYEDFISRKTFLTLQARSVGQKVNDDMVYKDLVEERIMYLKLKEYNYVIEDTDVSRRLENIAKQYNMTLDQFSKQLKAEGISYEEYRNSIKKQIAMENLYGLVINNNEITDAEADEFYNNAKDKSVFEVDTLVKLSWIFFKASTFTEKGEKQELAGKVRAMAARGQDFSELAAKYSDDEATKNNGGDLGYNLLYDAGKRSLPAQVNAGLTLAKRGYKVGTVSSVRELVGKGFYIVKIVGIEKDMESIRTRVKNYLGESRMRESFIKWLDEETKRVSVQLYK